VRIYLPVTMTQLRGLHENSRLTPSPLLAHAITADFVAATADIDDEEREYVALMAAAHESLQLIAATGGEPRRVVVSADVDDQYVHGRSGVATAVEVSTEISLRQCSSVHIDEVGAQTAVAEAVTGLASSFGSASASGVDSGAADSIHELDDHELLWFATQEIPDLLD